MPIRARHSSAEQFIPAVHNLNVLRDAIQDCRGCPLYLAGTQPVFGEGTREAEIMLVGEQPGDCEDQEGRPFVGPAGHLLDRCLEQAGVDRSTVYITNVVKHFKWEPRGKWRIHKRPNALEVTACRPWFDAELETVKPKLVVCMGATAAQALLGKAFRVTQRRGELIDLGTPPFFMATVHPSAILRTIDKDARALETRLFIEDLKQAAVYAERLQAA
jgi:uracil-DNA glycosylase